MRYVSLWFAAAAPALYYIGLFAGAASWPGYDHATQYASELGSAAAPSPEIFNYAIMSAGVAAVLGAVGVGASLRKVSGSWFFSMLTALTLMAWGAAMVMGGAFPMPNELHNAFGLGLAIQATPLFSLAALRRTERASLMKLLLAFVLAASGALLAVMFGVGELVARDNVGWWQRAYAAASIPWVAILALWLAARAGRSA